MPRRRDQDAVLVAAEAAVALIVEQESLKPTVAELAAAAGIPQRTFYRWFGTKEQVLRPVFDWGTDVFAEKLVAADGSVHEDLVAGFTEVLWGEREARTRALFPLVFGDAATQAVFFFAVHDGEHRILPALAERLGVAADSARARAVAGAIVTALRVALEDMVRTGDDPRARYAEMLEASGIPRHG